jgi:hypothetical protein
MSDEIWKERFTQSGRADAWHKKGTHFDPTNKDLTLADVIVEAGMDYRIEVLPLSVDVEVPDFDDPQSAIDPNAIPANVIQALADVRESGVINMFDRAGVIDIAAMYDDDAGTWLIANKDRYMDSLNAMGAFVSGNGVDPNNQLSMLTAPTSALAVAKTRIVRLETGQNAIIRMPHSWHGAVDAAKVLGTCSDRYTPVQNCDLAAMFETVSKTFRPETAGVLKQGEIAFFTLNAGQFDVRVNGHDDAHNAYIYVVDRKTPGSVLTVGAGSTRIVCWNTLQAGEASARILIPLLHDESINDMLTAIAKALEGLASAQKAMRDAYQMMADKPMTIDIARNVFEIAWPNPRLSQTVLSLDTASNPMDTANNTQIDQIAKAMGAFTEQKILADRIKAAESRLADQMERAEWMRETAESSLLHMADAEGLGINGYTIFNAASETCEHRLERTRGDVASDMLIGDRSRILDRVYSHLMDIARN